MFARQTRSTASVNNYLYANENHIDIELKCAICQQPFGNPKVGSQCSVILCDISAII
jgi:hypothetical protein